MDLFNISDALRSIEKKIGIVELGSVTAGLGEINESLRAIEKKLGVVEEAKFESVQSKEKAVEMDNCNSERMNFRLAKIVFPRFDGENPRVWSSKCENFFELCPVPEHQKVLFASFHFEGRAEIWFQSYFLMKGRVDWKCFVDDLCARFGRHDIMEEFRKLQQLTTVSAYIDRFEEVLALVIYEARFSEEFVVKSFVSGIKDEIRIGVQMFNPRTLSQAYRLARLQEAAIEARQSRSFNNNLNL